MDRFTRRDTLALGAGALASTLALGQGARAAIPMADVKPPAQEIEKGATLRVLRPTRFVDPDETIFRANTEAFVKATGVPVRVDFVGWEDLRPQTAVTANTGAGPDIVLGWHIDPQLYADKLLNLNELADYLGKKYGGWYFLAEKYAKKWGTNDWIAIPMGGSTGPIVYRESWVKEAGFDKIPNDLDQFLTLCRNLKKNGHPAGFALGNAVGDANGHCNWLLWAHNSFMIDEKGQVAINRKETIEALKYAKELYQHMIPGTISWQDPSNNKAYLAEEIGLTANGVSIYYALVSDPKTKHIAADTNHALRPEGRAGKNPDASLIVNAMIFRHSKFPNAAKEYMRFMMEAEQYDKWLSGCLGYWAQPLKAYAESQIWKSDPKLLAFRDGCGNQYWEGYKGPITAAAAAVNANYVNVHMFAAVSNGQSTPEDAVAEAERQAKRYYKS